MTQNPSRNHQNQLILPLVATALGVGLYALAVLWSSRHPSWLTVVLAVLPAVWFAAVYAKGAVRSDLGALTRVRHVVPLVLILVALGFAWTPLANNVRLLYLVQHVGVHAALCWIFARTLASGRTPLCTEFASWVHEDMSSPRLLWYTRQVTNAWAIFFALTAVASVVLFVYAQPSVWTFFSAVLGPALTAAVFVVENLLRSYFLPPKDRVGLAGTWRAVQARIQDQRRTRAAPRTP